MCAALASCQESSLRTVANVYRVRIESLSVHVDAEVDVRGTPGMAAGVPVGFQAIRVHVLLRVADGTAPKLLRQLCRTAERACVVLQTLRSGGPVFVSIDDSPALSVPCGAATSTHPDDPLRQP